MAAVSDLYEIKLKQRFGSTNPLNVFHVERKNSGVNAADIAGAFIDSILPLIQAAQHNQVTAEELEVMSLSSILDFTSVSLSSLPGLLGGEALPSFNSFVLQFPRLRTDVRSGRKSFVGLSELNVVGNSIDAAQISRMQGIGNVLLTDWETAAQPGVDICHFVILGRVCDQFDSEGKCVRYRLPQTDLEVREYRPLSFIAHDRVRSQVSRKVL